MSIISISGKKQSGKNTIAKIINQLTNNKYEEKCFADKLKDIICILINCTREQLEDESFKNKKLGEEWWYYKTSIDNTIIKGYLQTTDKELTSWKKRSIPFELIKPTPRFLLQFIGTNLFRNQLHPEIWVTSLMSEYKPYPKGTAHNLKDWSELYRHTSCKNCGKSYLGWKRQSLCKKCIEDNSVQFYPSWCITDMRFPNEMEAVKKRGGITIRVNRPCNICGGSGYHKMSCPVSKSGEHYSETALDKAEFDYIIDNNGSIEELIEKVKEILIKEKLL